MDLRQGRVRQLLAAHGGSMIDVGSAQEQRQLPASEARACMDPVNWGSFREQAHRMLDDMLGYIEHMREQPVWRPIPDEVRARFREDLPSQPTPLAQVHEEFLSSVLPYVARNGHPGFLGWVQGGGTVVGMLAEMLAAGLNANVGGRDQAPLELERQLVDWMRALFGFPVGASGLVVNGTSMANLLAVVLARHAALGPEVRTGSMAQNETQLTAYASVHVHGCVARGLEFAGLGRDALRLIPGNREHQIDLEALRQAIAVDRRAGRTPFLLIGTAGTVDIGAVDDLAGLAGIGAEQRLWFHVDGAFGAWTKLIPEFASRLQGIERADSLAFDFHKWAQVPYDAGFLLVRDGAQHREAFSAPAPYLMRGERGMSAGSPWPCDLGLDLSRGFRALKVWMTLKVFGTDAIAAVVRRSCELARRLEDLIAINAELELMAPVQMNIVCFRYRSLPARSRSAGDAEKALDRLNREIVDRLQEAGAVAPSTTLVGGRVVIRAAFVNHRTELTEVRTLIDATLAAGRALQDGTDLAPQAEAPPAIALAAAAQSAPTGEKAREVALRYKRADLLHRLGRTLEARSEYLKALELDPTHLPTLIDLGRMLLTNGQRGAAQIVYTEAVRLHPENVVCRVNLGGTLIETDPSAAREHYEVALSLSEDFPQAHCGLYYALKRLGQPELAEQHRQKGFAKRALIHKPYRGEARPITVLLLVSSEGGNVPIETLLDEHLFETYIVIADFFDPKMRLPAHALVVNGIGDVDAAEPALLGAERLLAFTAAPVINSPSAVRATSRCGNADRLGRLPGVVTPITVQVPQKRLAGATGAEELLRLGLQFPVLLRAPGFHMGQHFIRVESAPELPAAIGEFFPDASTTPELLAIKFLEARGADGFVRKYRVMMINGRLYPLHLAIADQWKIHYFSAAMQDNPAHRAEEARFLNDMPSVLGNKAMTALACVQEALALEYAGIDFGLSSNGELLLFEANATMVVEMPDGDSRWDYRRQAVERIHAAIREMLTSTSAIS